MTKTENVRSARMLVLALFTVFALIVLVWAIFDRLLTLVRNVRAGVPGALLTGRLSRGEPLRIEALGLVFLTAGWALWLDLSYLIAGMTAGAVIVNTARHHTRAFHEIEHIQWPYLIVFFILAGASLDLDVLWTVGGVGVAYVVLRIMSRMLGGWLGATLVAAPRCERIWYGPALLPQAGVAVGVALVAADHMPDSAAEIMALTIGATVVFELIGPIVAAIAIRRATGD